MGTHGDAYMDAAGRIGSWQQEMRGRVDEAVASATSLTDALSRLWTGWQVTYEDTFPELGGWMTWLFRDDADRIGVVASPRKHRNWNVSERARWERVLLCVSASAYADTTGKLLRWLDAGQRDWTAAAIRAVLVHDGNPDPDTAEFMVAMGMYEVEDGGGHRLKGIAGGLTNPKQSLPSWKPDPALARDEEGRVFLFGRPEEPGA